MFQISGVHISRYERQPNVPAVVEGCKVQVDSYTS